MRASGKRKVSVAGSWNRWENRSVSWKFTDGKERRFSTNLVNYANEEKKDWSYADRRKFLRSLRSFACLLLFLYRYTYIYIYVYIYICLCIYMRILFGSRSVFGKRAISHRHMHATMYRLAMLEPSDVGTSRLSKFFFTHTYTIFAHVLLRIYIFIYIYIIIYLYMYMYIVLRLRHTIMPVLSNPFYVYHTYTLTILFEEK